MASNARRGAVPTGGKKRQAQKENRRGGNKASLRSVGEAQSLLKVATSLRPPIGRTPLREISTESKERIYDESKQGAPLRTYNKSVSGGPNSALS